MDLREPITLDAATTRRTRDGYLTSSSRIARTGVQIYRGIEVGRPEMDQVRVFRPESEVFNKDAMHSFAHRPLTNDHPPVAVTADNWKEFSVGQTGDEVAKDGAYIRVPMVLMDAAVIREVEAGKRQLSMGYTCDLDWTAGSHKGADYDAVQTNIRGNHVAVVKAARGGPALQIGDQEVRIVVEDRRSDDRRGENMTTTPLRQITVDGLSVEVTDQAAQVIDRFIRNQEAIVTDLKGKLASSTADLTKLQADAAAAVTAAAALAGTKDAQIATLQTQLKDAAMTPEKLDGMVKDRALVCDKAKVLMPQGLVIDGKSTAEIRKQVVDAKLGETAKGWTDDQIAASFAALTATVDGTQRLATVFQAPGNGGSIQTQRDQAYDGYVKDQTEAWKGAGHKPGPVTVQ